jgi:cytochrome P450
MHAFRVHAAVLRRLRLRSHTITDLVQAEPVAIETIRDADGCTHLVASAESCAAILGDAAFEPADIDLAVSTVGRSFDTDVSGLGSFLQHTPLLASGAEHKTRRHRFLQHHHQMRSRHAAFIQEHAERLFADLEPVPAGGLSDRLVIPYVDDVLRRIFDSEIADGAAHFDRLSAGPSTILELLHHPRTLGDTSRRVAEFLAAVDLTSPSGCPADDAARPHVLLAYVLMGRDPLIGALSAFVHDLALTPRDPAQRAEHLGGMSASRLFQMTAPVNYIGRKVAARREIGGVPMQVGDRVLLMPPFANAPTGLGGSAGDLAFGQGPHGCAGSALALAIGEAYLGALRLWADRLDWSALVPDTLIPSVFLRYQPHP